MSEWSSIIQALGGIGLFLLGMTIMTEGLKALAGAQLHGFLMRATHSPLSGALTGAASTAILQSSSATTVAAVGFVSAGLLSFSNALGVIFGANLGTTITGWMVALLGFKLKLGALSLPLIFIGVLLRLFGKTRLAQVGYAMAGFGLIFVGIDFLQQAAGGIDLLKPEQMPQDSWLSRAQLLLLGVIATIVTQSSSAGVATTLVAVNAGVIQFEQAAALVIGMDVGTTVTAALAATGGSPGTRRTGLSHVIYNLFTAVGAFFLITPFLYGWQMLTQQSEPLHSEIMLVAFHSGFNLLGVVLVLPFANQFSALMHRLIPDQTSQLEESLDSAFLKEPAVALASVSRIIRTEFQGLMVKINLILEQQQEITDSDLQALQKLLDETHRYLDRIHIGDLQNRESPRLIALIHALDHMQRLHERCDEDLERALTASSSQTLREVRIVMADHVEQITAAVKQEDWDQAVHLSAKAHETIDGLEHPQRAAIYREVSAGRMDVPEATDCTEALRWMSRSSRHIARICYYLEVAGHR